MNFDQTTARAIVLHELVQDYIDWLASSLASSAEQLSDEDFWWAREQAEAYLEYEESHS